MGEDNKDVQAHISRARTNLIDEKERFSVVPQAGWVRKAMLERLSTFQQELIIGSPIDVSRHYQAISRTHLIPLIPADEKLHSVDELNTFLQQVTDHLNQKIPFNYSPKPFPQDIHDASTEDGYIQLPQIESMQTPNAQGIETTVYCIYPDVMSATLARRRFMEAQTQSGHGADIHLLTQLQQGEMPVVPQAA